MKKVIAIAFCFTRCIFFALSQQVEPSLGIGIGVVSINYVSQTNKDKNIDFFLSPESKRFTVSLQYIDEQLREGNGEFCIKPLEFMPTPGRILFRCIGETKQMYQVVVNESTKEVNWLKKEAMIEFHSWLSYLQGSQCIENNLVSNPLRKKPRFNSDIVEAYNTCNKFEINLMKGEWIKISTSYMCDQGIQVDKPISGWIKWCNGDKIIVNKLYSE